MSCINSTDSNDRGCSEFDSYFVPCSYEEIIKMETYKTISTLPNATSCNTVITPIIPGEYCFRLIPKFNSSNNIHQTIRFTAYSNSFPIANLIPFKMLSKSQKPISVIQQVSSSNFLIINFAENANSSLLFTPDFFRSFFTIPLHSVSPSQDSVFYDHFSTFAFNSISNVSFVYSHGASFQLNDCFVKAIDWAHSTSSVACVSVETGNIFIRQLSEEIHFLSDDDHRHFLYINTTNQRIVAAEFVPSDSDSLSLSLSLLKNTVKIELSLSVGI